MTGCQLTDAAEADLRNIIRYTRKQWGNAQVRSYIASWIKLLRDDPKAIATAAAKAAQASDYLLAFATGNASEAA